MTDSNNLLEGMKLLIPIAGIVMGCAIPIVAIYCEYRKRRDIFEMIHKERLASIEKGVPVPPLPEELTRRVLGTGNNDDSKPSRPEDYLRGGLICLLTGLALTAALYMLLGMQFALIGLIPAGVGLALLLYYSIQSKKPLPPEPAIKTPDTTR